jgi:hypothetical protein
MEVRLKIGMMVSMIIKSLKYENVCCLLVQILIENDGESDINENNPIRVNKYCFVQTMGYIIIGYHDWLNTQLLLMVYIVYIQLGEIQESGQLLNENELNIEKDSFI